MTSKTAVAFLTGFCLLSIFNGSISFVCVCVCESQRSILCYFSRAITCLLSPTFKLSDFDRRLDSAQWGPVITCLCLPALGSQDVWPCPASHPVRCWGLDTGQSSCFSASSTWFPSVSPNKDHVSWRLPIRERLREWRESICRRSLTLWAFDVLYKITHHSLGFRIFYWKKKNKKQIYKTWIKSCFHSSLEVSQEK